MNPSSVWLFFWGSGQSQTELHPAAAADSDCPAQDQAEAVRTHWSWEEQSAGVSEMWHPAQLLQEEEDDTHDQHSPPPQLPHQLQTPW